jgi:hypothetical protein
MVHLRPVAPGEAEALDNGGAEAQQVIAARYAELAQSLLGTPAGATGGAGATAPPPGA